MAVPLQPGALAPCGALHLLRSPRCPSSRALIKRSAFCCGGLRVSTRESLPIKGAQESVERIREQLLKDEISPSSYDTAWVALVPSPASPEVPCFPQCLGWISQNQHADGSWGLLHLHPSLVKYTLCSTLACVLALRRWNVGEECVRRGLHFIGSNFSYALAENLVAPYGFDIIFSGMLQFAIDLGLDIPVSQSIVHEALRLRALELERWPGNNSVLGNNSHIRNAYMAYVAEGLVNLQDWYEVMTYQKKNGSIFNSPSTTAAALTQIYDAKALEYLNSLLQRFGNSVPAAYPVEIFTRLCMVDTLQKLGISHHFTGEIKRTLDTVYRCWLQNDEEVFSDMATSAIAFRLLSMRGYDVSSDFLFQLDEADRIYESIPRHLKDMKTTLELYKAAQIKIFANELILDNIGPCLSKLLKEGLFANPNHGPHVIDEEVDYTLKFPFYSNLERLEHKRNIEHFSVVEFQIGKASYMVCSIYDDLLRVAVEDFNLCQSIYREEIQHLESWVKENKLDQLEFARQKLTYCYLSAAATLFSPKLSDTRISWAKNGVLTTVVDDFFDGGGSREELENLTTLVEKWDGNHEKEFYSESVKIIFSSLYSTINDLGAKASVLQNRSVTNHLVEIWLALLRSMMNEAQWQSNKSAPTMEQYMTSGVVSMALGPIILPALYFVGPKLTEDVIEDPEYHNLYRLVSSCGRLLNDIQSFEREGKQGKLNAVTLLVHHSGGAISIEEAKKAMQSSINTHRADLLRLVLRDGGAVPRPCKELFWKMSKILHLFYMRNDGFSSPSEMVSAVNAVIYQPLNRSCPSPATSRELS